MTKKIDQLLTLINEGSEIITKEQLSTKWNESSENLETLFQTLNLNLQSELIETVAQQFAFLSLEKEIAFKIAETLDLEISKLNQSGTCLQRRIKSQAQLINNTLITSFF